MKNLFLILIAFFSLKCSSGIVGNGHIIETTVEVPNFQDLSVSGTINTEIVTDNVYKVKIIGDENVVSYVQTEVKGGELQIQFEKKANIKNSHVRVVVSVPFLNNIKLEGSGNITSDSLIQNSQMVVLKSSGSGHMNLNINAPAVQITGSGSGDFLLSGDTKDLNCTLTGSGSIDSKELKAENAKVKITGSGDARVFASVDLSTQITGSGNIFYWGNPSLSEVKISGSGKVKGGE